MRNMYGRGANSAQEDNDGHKLLRSVCECVNMHKAIVECSRGNVNIECDDAEKHCVQEKCLRLQTSDEPVKGLCFDRSDTEGMVSVNRCELQAL